jgi:hypothetical protein
MSSGLPGERKRRTREHVIADLSLNFVERFILEAGFTAQRWHSDYGYDLTMVTFDEHGFVEPGLVFWQLKASESLRITGEEIAFDVDVKDFNLWIRERFLVILLLYDVAGQRGYWLDIQGYFRANPGRRPRTGAKTVRVRVPVRQRVNRRTLPRIRLLKQELDRRLEWRVVR